MHTSCLINNFNYRPFVGEAVDSVLAQSLPFDEIIVVDDGSTDGSADFLKARYRNCPTLRVIAKPNRGQLSCFNEGFLASSGDLVFFLDADDTYERTYLEEVRAVYEERRDCDFVFTARTKFGQEEGEIHSYPVSRDLGYSVVRGLCAKSWIGASTSALSMRREIVEQILPIPHVRDWITRADDCLVFGASLAGARKFYLDRPLVKYRVHAANRHYKAKQRDPGKTFRRSLALDRFFRYMTKRLDLDFNRSSLLDYAHQEFCTIERPTGAELREYVRLLAKSKQRLFRKLSAILCLYRHKRYPRRFG